MASDHEEIRNLLYRYCELMDAADFAAVGTLFADGALCDDHGREIANGREAVAHFYERIIQLHDGSPRTLHTVLNPIVNVDGTDASVRSVYIVYQSLGDVPIVIITGRYDDVFEKVDDRWRFAERRFSVEQTGDLSKHLRGIKV